VKATERLAQRMAERDERIGRTIKQFDVQSSDSLTLGDFYDVEITSPEKPAADMSIDKDYRHELHLRDEQLRRELDLRQESFRSEQAIRDQAWNERFSGFLSQQAERDKRFDDSVEAIRTDISRLGSLKLNIWGAMLTTVGIGIAVAALSVSVYQTGKSDQTTSQSTQTQAKPQPIQSAPAQQK
jgi:hypothetical protein